MTDHTDALAGPHLVEAQLLFERARVEAVETSAFAHVSNTLITERARITMTPNLGDVTDTLDGLAAAILQVQSVIVARDARRTIPSIHTFDVNLSFGAHPDECANKDEHFHLLPVFRDEQGEPFDLNPAEAEAFGGVLNVFSLNDLTICRVFERQIDLIDVDSLLTQYPVPELDSFFDIPTHVDLDMAKPLAVAKALMDDETALRFVNARLAGVHEQPVPPEVLERAKRWCYTTWIHNGTDESMRSAIFLGEIKFARLAQKRFPGLHALSVTLDDDDQFAYHAIGDEGFDPEGAAALFHQTVLAEGGVTMFTRRKGWNTYFEIDARANLAPAT